MTADYPIVKGVSFKGIPGFSNHCAGDDGSIWGRVRPNMPKSGMFSNGWRRLKPLIHKNGYIYCCIRRDGDSKNRTYRVHRLIMEAFVGPRPDGMVCCHTDGDRSNNRLSNLRWDTQANNEVDKVVHGTKVMGSAVFGAKRTEEEVALILELAANGTSQLEIAQTFGMTRRAVNYIVNRRTWKHVG